MESLTEPGVLPRGSGSISLVTRGPERRRLADLAATADHRAGVLGLHRVSVVIPTLNEAENLPLVLPRIPAWVAEVVLVDGNSTDGTPDAAHSFWEQFRRRQDDPRLQVVMQKKKGKGEALRTGFAAANGDIIVMLDADGSTDPAEIPRFVGMLLSGSDFAKGSRFLQGGGTSDMPLYRKLGNWSFVALVRLLFGGQYTDLCYGYNAFWRRVLDDLELDGDGFEIETVMNVRALKRGLRLAEVPSFEAERIYGSSHLRTIPDGWRVLTAIGREWRTRSHARTGLALPDDDVDSAPIQLRPEDRAADAPAPRPSAGVVPS
jgi:glycosyltransferase involved in cell wall biosynthesis